mmetsp:Transcript_30487/g.29877  ORF Transcript_30487/g.29877 Transcript_30487/m.29877 type:complete len:96 (-) Transcript_30487:630-917(-)
MALFKSLEEFLQAPDCVEVFMSNTNVSFKIFESTSQWLARQKNDSQQKKNNPLKLCPVIIDTLKKLYQFFEEGEEVNNQNFKNLIINSQNTQIIL